VPQQQDNVTSYSNWEEVDIYRLLFGTPFIDKTVGKEIVCDLTKEKCIIKGCADYINSGIGPCTHIALCNLADYHLTQMLKIRMDIDKLKEYVINLTEV
jgi:hypothetical protein